MYKNRKPSRRKMTSTQCAILLQMLDAGYHDTFMLGARLTTMRSLLDRGYVQGGLTRSQITTDGLNALEKEYSGREYSIEQLQQVQQETLAHIADARLRLQRAPGGES